MSFDTICEISYAALIVITLGVPAWMVFVPPRRVRSWPLFCRPLLGVATGQIAIYGLFYCFVYPASSAYAQAHPNTLLCGILCVQPSGTVIPITIVTAVFLLLRSVFFVFRFPKIYG